MKIIETDRLILRTWKKDDAHCFALINQDPNVTRFLGKTMTIFEAEKFAQERNKHFDKYNYTLWALEIKNRSEFIGFIGLNMTTFEATFTPCIEVGWHLSFKHWGQGYATEAARASINYGFECIGLKEIVSFTVPANLHSIKVMERIGMARDFKGDFLHPKFPDGHELSKHILYRIKNNHS